MDISNIPKTFWHALSIAILVATIGVVVIAFRSSTVSIEIADVKIELARVVEETGLLITDIQQDNAQLSHIRNSLQEKIEMLKALPPLDRQSELDINFLMSLEKDLTSRGSLAGRDQRIASTENRLKDLKKTLHRL